MSDQSDKVQPIYGVQLSPPSLSRFASEEMGMADEEIAELEKFAEEVEERTLRAALGSKTRMDATRFLYEMLQHVSEGNRDTLLASLDDESLAWCGFDEDDIARIQKLRERE